MKGARKHLILLVVALVCAIAGGAYAASGEGKLKVKIPASPELYSADPQPLTVTQCGQCHPGYFKDIRQDGAKHKFDCQKCHATFHAYNPKKANYDALMPKCGTCHNEPHGAKITDCANCHSNPHTPKKMVANARLAGACGQCHVGPQEQLTKNLSKHTKVACSKCHTSHGYIPACSMCHKPHHAGQEFSTCLACHPVHNPKLITYPKDSPAVTCGSCHTKIYDKWKKTPSKHAKVNCAQCHHTKHKYVPKCTECHAAPHNKAFLSRFPKCLDCHLDVHDLPAAGKK